jgi:hypothetical protein
MDDAISRSSKSFRDARSRSALPGTSPHPESLRTLTGDPTYEAHERAVRAGFVDLYTGKVYSDGVATEIVTMGAERFTSPRQMLDLYARDPEHFLFVLGLMNQTRAGGVR